MFIVLTNICRVSLNKSDCFWVSHNREFFTGKCIIMQCDKKYRSRKKTRKSRKSAQNGLNLENETWASMYIKQKKGSKQEVSNWICFKLKTSMSADALCDIIRKKWLIPHIALIKKETNTRNKFEKTEFG